MPIYSCEKCSFQTSQKNDFRRHQNRKISCEKSNANLIINSNANISKTNPVENEELKQMKEMLLQLQKQNEELQKQRELKEKDDMINMLKLQLQLQQQQPQSIIIQQPQTQAVVPLAKEINKRNIVKKMKDKLKGCMTINEFINNIVVSREDYERFSGAGTRENKFANGISALFINNWKKLKENEKPCFCSNDKAKKFHFKFENVEKYEETKIFYYEEFWDNYKYSTDEYWIEYRNKYPRDEYDFEDIYNIETGEYTITQEKERKEIKWFEEDRNSYNKSKIIIRYLAHRATKFMNTYFDFKNTKDKYEETMEMIGTLTCDYEDKIEYIISLICSGCHITDEDVSNSSNDSESDD